MNFLTDSHIEYRVEISSLVDGIYYDHDRVETKNQSCTETFSFFAVLQKPY